VLSNYRYSGFTLPPGTYKIGLKGGNLAQGRYVFVDVVSFPAVGPPADTTPPEIILHNECPGRTTVQTASSSDICLFSSNETVEFSCSFGPWPNESAVFEPCSAPGEPQFGYFSFDVSQSEGKKLELRVRAVDSAGNVSEKQMIWTVDTIFPTIAITSGPEEGSVVNTNSVSFGWEANDNQEVRDVQCHLEVVGTREIIRVDGAALDDPYCGGTIYTGESRNPAKFSNLADGEYTFWVSAVDKAGQGVFARRTFTVDTAP
jgi:hypothetical protein